MFQYFFNGWSLIRHPFQQEGHEVLQFLRILWERKRLHMNINCICILHGHHVVQSQAQRVDVSFEGLGSGSSDLTENLWSHEDRCSDSCH